MSYNHNMFSDTGIDNVVLGHKYSIKDYTIFLYIIIMCFTLIFIDVCRGT